MLSFSVYTNGRLADNINLSGAYLLGSDDVPLRAEITVREGTIRCKKRAAGPAGLVILWEVPRVGTILTETVRLQEREAPYILQVELARGRLMRINHKLEDWGLYDYEGSEKILTQIDKARDTLIKALQAGSPSEAAALGDESLAQAAKASEALACFHADIFLTRRKEVAGFGKQVFGCGANLPTPTELSRKRLNTAFDFVSLPLIWSQIEPSEQTFDWKPLDAWVETLAKQKKPIHAGPLLSFQDKQVPDWLYIWEHDFDTVRDLAFEHLRRVLNRYGQYIQTWTAISGIHANCCFAFSFEQLMELTRMAAAVTKQIAPRSAAVIDLVAPWGEYYARNQRTIPPLLYADMVLQSGIEFDAFGVQFHFGPDIDGMFLRDMFQLSSLLDQLAKLGKPVHISAMSVPSAQPQSHRAKSGASVQLDGGAWHGSWTEDLQSEWLDHFLSIALSKPFVESVSWSTLADHEHNFLPGSGLLKSDLAPKAAYHRLAEFRAEIFSSVRGTGGPSGA